MSRDAPSVFLALAACPCRVVLACFGVGGAVFESGLLLFDFRIEFEAPIQTPPSGRLPGPANYNLKFPQQHAGKSTSF